MSTATEEDVEVESDELHKETIEIDLSKEQPQTTEVVPVDDRTMVKQVVEHQVQPGGPTTFEIQIGLPEAPKTTSTTIVQETTTYTQVRREVVEEGTTGITEGPTTRTTSVVMSKGEEAAPIELRVSIPVEPAEGQVVEHLTEATRVVTSEVRQIPVQERPSEERHSETIEIIKQEQPQEVQIQVPVTRTETVEVHREVEHRRESAQRIEIEILETQIQREPKPQELEIPIGKVSKTEIDIDVVDAPATQAPRPTEDVVEETRQTITKETKVIQFETEQPQPVLEEAQIEVSLVAEESAADVEETEAKVPIEDTVIGETEIVSKSEEVPSEVQMEIELVPEEKPVEQEAVTFEETITVDTQDTGFETPVTAPVEQSKVEDTIEVQTAEDTLEVEETEMKAPVEEIIITERKIVEKSDIVPSEVQLEVELVPEEKPGEQEMPAYEETVTVDTQAVDTEIPITVPTEESKVEDVVEVQAPEVTTEVEEVELSAPTEDIIVTQRESIEKVEGVPSEVQMEVELVPEEKPEDQEAVIFQETVTVDTQPVEAETPVAAPIEESKVEDVMEIQTVEITAEVPETEAEAPTEEVIVSERETIAKAEEIPSEVQIETELVPEEKPEEEEAVMFEESVTIDVEAPTTETQITVSLEESKVEDVIEGRAPEVTTDVDETEMKAPVEEIIITEREMVEKSEKVPTKVQMEIELVPEEKPDEQEAPTLEKTITIDTQPVALETQVSAPEEETQVEVREVIEVPDTAESFVTEKQISQIQEVPFEEVTLDIKVKDQEGVEPGMTTTEVEQIVVSEIEEVKESHREEIELQIAGKQLQQEEIQFTLQVQPTELTKEKSELEIPVSEEVSIDTETFVSEVEVAEKEVEVEERHREELTLQIEGKQQELEEVQLTLQVEEKEQPEETPVTEVAAPSVEQVSNSVVVFGCSSCLILFSSWLRAKESI